jgi:hypothetical protein
MDGYTNAPAATEQVTLENVVSLADQVDAAVRDVNEAWSYFLYGPSPETVQPTLATPVSNDRMDRTSSSLRQSVATLRTLAEVIRGRAS